MAEWLRRGLQILLSQFDSGRGLHKNSRIQMIDKEEDLNYSFLAKLFSRLSETQKEKIFQVLRNTRTLEKTG